MQFSKLHRVLLVSTPLQSIIYLLTSNRALVHFGRLFFLSIPTGTGTLGTCVLLHCLVSFVYRPSLGTLGSAAPCLFSLPTIIPVPCFFVGLSGSRLHVAWRWVGVPIIFAMVIVGDFVDGYSHDGFVDVSSSMVFRSRRDGSCSLALATTALVSSSRSFVGFIDGSVHDDGDGSASRARKRRRLGSAARQHVGTF